MKLHSLLLSLLLVATGSTFADTPQYLGSMTPYPLEIEAPAIPDSLRPVGVVFVARHGARYLSSPSKADKLGKMLTEAQDAGRLTYTGEKMLQIISRIKEDTGDNWGMLDSLGYEEEHALASRMYRRMPELLSSGTIVARSTYVPRAVMSMYTFVYQLATDAPYLNIITREGPEQDSLLRFFDTDKAYMDYLKTGPWERVYDEYAEKHVPLSPALSLISDRSDLTDAQLRDITLEEYALLRSLPAMGLDEETEPFFSESDFDECWRVTNLAHYLKRTATSLSDIPAQAALPLLTQILDDFETIVDPSNRVHAKMYFGHAETLMPLLSLMQVEGCNAPEVDAAEVWKVWNDSKIVPLGANLELDLLLAPSGTVYVVTLLNGSCVSPYPGLSSLAKLNDLARAWGEVERSIIHQ